MGRVSLRNIVFALLKYGVPPSTIEKVLRECIGDGEALSKALSYIEEYRRLNPVSSNVVYSSIPDVQKLRERIEFVFQEVKGRVDRLDESVSALQRTVDRLLDDLANLIQRIQILESRVNTVEVLRKKVEELSSVVEVLEKQVGKFDSWIRGVDEELKLFEASIIERVSKVIEEKKEESEG